MTSSGRTAVCFKRGVVLAFVFCLSFSALGTQTEIWTLSSFQDFQQGESEQISITGQGELLLAPQITQPLPLKNLDLFVWALARDSKGNVYVGTGEQGKVFKIVPGGDVSVFFDSPEISIMSLALDAADNVYAGSAPDGLIYKITPDGNASTFFQTGENYVWSLALDADTTLYAGTGGAGKIFKVQPDGTGNLLYDSPQSHIMSVVYDPAGWLYAGTEGKGITYKVGLNGQAFALYDAEEEEIRALALDSQGNLYIAAISSEFYAKAQTNPMEPPELRPQEQKSKKTSIYQIAPAGTVRKIVDFPDMLVYAMIAEPDGNVLVGTDHKGGLYRVFPKERTYHQMLQVNAANILALLRDSAGQVFIGTGDKGGVYQLAPELAEQGTFLSPVYDAKSTAAWGNIMWRGATTQIALITRTGNTSVPDDTWSSWSGELRNREGAAITNPPARFIQWKAILKAAEDQVGPVLEEVSVAYLPHNLPPEIQHIAIIYPSQSAQQNQTAASNAAAAVRKPAETSKPGTPAPPIPPTGYLTFAWTASDPNNDGLEYTVELRGDGETAWRTLEQKVNNPFYVLDTSMLADGRYYVKITAADLPGNPPDRVLRAEKVSERFEIDNTPPEISIALNQKQDSHTVQITVIVQDDFSRLFSAEYALDGKEWIGIFPDDAVTDSREEKYSIALSDLTPDEHLLVFRAKDIHDNIGVGKFVFSAAPPPSTPTPDPQPTPKK